SSSSSSVCDPISLAGPRCSASSMTPLLSSQEGQWPAIKDSRRDSRPRKPALSEGSEEIEWVQASEARQKPLHRLLHLIHLFDLLSQRSCNRIAFQVAIRGKQSIFDRKRLTPNVKCSYLLVMRHSRIDQIDRTLHLFTSHITSHNCRQIAAPISDQDHLLRTQHVLQQLFFDRFRRHVVPGSENNQVLDSPHNLPVPRRFYFPLFASMNPLIPQAFRCFLRTFQISGKDIWPANNNFVLFGALHLDPGNRRTTPPRLNLPRRIVHRTDRRRFR